jgi:beta-N-acetylhexosaminidase
MNAGHFLFVGISGHHLDRSTAKLFAAEPPGGIVLFDRNLDTPDQMIDLVAELRRVVPSAVLAIDAEGGRVDRLKGLVGPSPPASLLARYPPAAAHLAGHWIAQALRLFDIDLDFAPVVDLDHGERDNALDGRYLGARVPAVLQRARAFLRGLHSGGVGGCLKHFPGLGGAAEDSHHKASVVSLNRQGLDADLRPFEALLPVAGATMVGHAVYPALDPQRPASLSAAIVDGLLREQMGFDGLVVSDDLTMKALDAYGELPARAEFAFAAGCDALLVCDGASTLSALPDIAARLARPRHAKRRAEADRRLTAHRQRLRTLRWTGDAVDLVRDRSRMTQLQVVRNGLAGLLADLQT